MHQKTLADIARGLQAGDFSSTEVTQHFLARIKQYDTDLNSFITVTEDTALAQAKAADQLRANGNAGILTGIPLAQKDIFNTTGVKTTCGSKMLDNYIAPYDATVIDKCQQAGMVMLGKTNMDEFAMGSSNETSFYGSVANPWHTDHVPGGSSGGSAAAVAARLAPIATGTDTGGSIRQPASLCGITGIKPSYGRISRWGMIAFASSLDQAGAMGLSAEDCALLLQQMSGFDSKDSTSADHPVDDYSKDLNASLDGLKIGLPKEYFGDGLEASVQKAVDDAIKVYESMGASVKEVSLPHSSLSVPVYYVIAPAECSSNLSRFDGVRFGYRCENPKDLQDLYERSRGEAFGAEVQRRIMIGTYTLSAGFYDAYYIKAQKTRRLISQDFNNVFQDVDVIMGPTTPDTAFKKGARADDPLSMYLSDIYTTAVNLAGLPGMSIPAGFANGLPIGLQLIGPYWSEAKLLNIAHRFQQETDYHQQIPAAYA